MNRVALGGVTVKKMYEPKSERAPWLILVEGEDVLRVEEFGGSTAGVNTWDTPKFGEGDVVDVSGFIEEYNGKYRVKVGKGGGIWRSEGASTGDTRVAQPAPAKKGQVTLQEAIDAIKMIQAAAVVSGIDEREWHTSLFIEWRRGGITLPEPEAGPSDDDIPF